MASGQVVFNPSPLGNQVPSDLRCVEFTSGGTHEVLVGDTLTGATGGATADVVLIEVTGGTWGGGDAAGFFILKGQSGAFESENLNEGANSNVCTIGADTTPGAATPARRNGTPIIEFDATNIEIAVFGGVLLPDYDDGGVTLTLWVIAASATTDEFIFSAAWSRVDTILDIDTDSWGGLQDSSATTVSGTAGIPVEATIAFDHGAEMDSLAAGEWGQLLVLRRTDLAGDDASGDMQIGELVVKET